MALLCFLASRNGQAATRDEALEALWPDVNPDTGTNSLHQAIYYLRRIFDPDYREGISAGYVTFDGEVIALDLDLIETASRHAWRLLRSSLPGDLGVSEQIWDLYEGRFALDFSYEEWAAAYRDTLHAAVLSRTEAAMVAGLATGEIERVIRLGTSALNVDPSADSIELQLLRAYKAAGRHAAAGEQYAHYSATLRGELGIEAPPYDSI